MCGLFFGLLANGCTHWVISTFFIQGSGMHRYFTSSCILKIGKFFVEWVWYICQKKSGLSLNPDALALQNILTQVNHFSPKLTTLFLKTALANKPPIPGIFPYSKFEPNLLTDWKAMAKKLTFCWLKVNYLAITFEPVVRLNPNGVWKNPQDWWLVC